MKTFVEPKSKNFRLFLQEEFTNRCKKNPNYSLRAFAKNLSISHATLSHILRGTRVITPELKLKLGKALGLDPLSINRFSEGKKQVLFTQKATPDFQQLTLDSFRLISNWEHDAILELTRVQGFKSDIKWIAKQLKISVGEANAAVERLQRMEMLEITSDGLWIDLAGDNTNILGDDFTDVASKRFQKEVLNKALHAIDNVDTSVRNNTSVMLAIDSNDIPEIKKRIKNFRRELTQYLQRKNAKPDQVYQIGIALYPLTEINKKEET